jgi:hypothetical protein
LAEAITPSMDATGWGALIQNAGFAGCILFILVVAMWRGARWIGAKVILPLTTRHIQFLDDVTKVMQSVAADNERIVATLTGVAGELKTAIEKIDKVHSVVLTAQNVAIHPEKTDGPTHPNRR